jgi:hypothetical protein
MTSSVSQTASFLRNSPKPLVGSAIALALTAWLAIVLILGARGAYAGAPGQPPLTVFVGAVVPLILFAVAMRTSQAFHEFALALDIRMIVAIQAWRYAGFGFIALYVNHVLPGLFAWPAGLGDMAIGIVAPLWIVALIRNPDVVASGRFRLWNALGMLDFVIAFTTATICAMTITDAGATSIAPMGQLPLVLIPEFMVPLFLMLHIIALMKTKRQKEE